MPSALFHAILCVVFLAVYVLACEVLIGARRRRRARHFRTDGVESPQIGWHCRKTGGSAIVSHG
ncbi:MAG: hypothetical protein RBS80_05080 [Thermoguttaceae bacterium]|nr:hypothetical protein [Thermoguttaceae bacterium]